MAENNDFPPHLDKVLFIKDLIRFMMRRIADVPYHYDTVEQFRESVYNGFNRTIEYAVRFLYSSMEMRYRNFFHSKYDGNAMNDENFNNAANSLAQLYFQHGSNAEGFLQYCVHLVSFATYLYVNGVQQAPDLAGMHIFNFFIATYTTIGGWVGLNTVAAQYAAEAPFVGHQESSRGSGAIPDLPVERRIENPKKRSIQEHALTEVPKKIRKVNTENANIFSGLETYPSTSGVSDAKKLN